MRKSLLFIITPLFISILIGSTCTHAQEIGARQLEQNFQNPPPSVRPRTWMHVMSGNMSKEGLTKDLEAMAEAGIGGIILFNVTHLIPKGPVKFNSPEHIELTAHAAAECERLGLSFGVHNCDGWTSSGAPWVSPEHSMKQIVHREVVVEGGEVNLRLPEPTKRGDYYKEVAVIAYPALASEVEDAKHKAIVTSSNPDFNINVATDGKIDQRTELKVSDQKNVWVQFDYGKPHTIRSFYLNAEKSRTKGKATLQSSNDGINFKDEQVLTVLRQGKKEYGIDEHFEGITARYFRFVTDMTFQIAEINLSSTYRFNNMLARTNLFKLENHRMPAIDEAPQDMVINKDEMLNLSGDVGENGIIRTKLPAGYWTIMRVGYTITGAVNSPASDEGRGWEVDKMDRESFRVFYEGYVRNVIEASKKVAPNALQYIEIDSYEVGGQNWTKDYPKYFKAHFGYDILDFLPLYAGRYIDNAATTDRILWDMRNFNSKLMTDNYFDYFTELCHEDGLISYVEPYSFNAGFNELDAARKVDITMGEFWMHQRYQAGTAVSGARIYGKNVVSAESFSARSDINFKGHPGTLKLTGDKAWTLGINEFMFHRYAHQANTHVKPGMVMSMFGSHIDRTQTWWENAGKAWFKYIARGQYLLRQGIPVSDVLAFVGDGSPNSILRRSTINDLPNRINYDCINSDALINRITVKDGKLVLPEGLSYHILTLSNVKEIHLSTLKKIAELADQGIIIIGNKPGKIGGYNISKEDMAEFARLVEKVWSKPTTFTHIGWEELYEKHNVPVDLMIKDGEDINYIHRKTTDSDIYFFYNPDSTRQTYQCTFNVDGKIPEFWNQLTGEITKLSAFEFVDGKTNVAITLPALGSGFVVFREPSRIVRAIAPENVIKNSNIEFTLSESNEPVFEVSENGKYNIKFTDGSEKQLSIVDIPAPIELDGSWDVTFPDVKSENKTFTFPSLKDWTTHINEQIRYYSGTGIYQKTFVIGKDMLIADKKWILDLGEVQVAARIILNGKDLGVVWMAPHTLDITSALVNGKNKLIIEVTNQWTNRLIGDENFPNLTGYSLRPHLNKQPLPGLNPYKMVDWYTNNEPAPLGERSTFTTYPFYKKGDQLLPAGLVGPVKIRNSKIVGL